LRRILHILDKDENIDCVGVEISTMFLSRRWETNPNFLDDILNILIQFKETSAKPLLVILSPVHLEAVAIEVRERLNNAGLPHYPTFEQAASALKRVLDYCKRKEAL
jgi:acyl-CoA synthetase (NDP forming)